ncbi:MAG: transposase-like protein [Paracoccaceae bacterium]|jgi:transposase-like protein
MTRRTFSNEFKIEAVRRVTERGVAVVHASRDIDVAKSVLRNSSVGFQSPIAFERNAHEVS